MYLIRYPIDRTFPCLPFITQISVRKITVITTSHRTTIKSQLRRPTLTIPRPEPTKAVSTKWLRVVRERFFHPILPPIFYRGVRRLLVYFRVIDIQFSLVPSSAPCQRLFRQLSAKFMRMAELMEVPLLFIHQFASVRNNTFPHPILSGVVLLPIMRSIKRFRFRHFTICPNFHQ